MPREPEDPIWGAPPKRFTVVGDDTPLVFHQAELPDPKTIPPRPWLYGTMLLRGYVSMLVAPGGTGKTGYALGIGLSLCSGYDLYGETMYARVNVGYLNLEDDLDEMNRRTAALMMHHRIPREEVEGRLFLFSGDERKITIAAHSEDGFEIVHPDEQGIIRNIVENQIGCLIVDPYAETHALSENSNSEMNKAVGAWRRIARATRCAILLVHHVRKGGVEGIDSARGAKSLTDAARVGIVLTTMTEDECAKFDVDVDERHSYVRIDDPKTNMATRSLTARWLQLQSVQIGNGRQPYSRGDQVAAVTRWVPPGLMGQLSIPQCNEALDLLAAGPRPGVRYTHIHSKGTTRWAGHVLTEVFTCSEGRAKLILNEWLRNGVLEARNYDDTEQRKPRLGLWVIDSLRPGTKRD